MTLDPANGELLNARADALTRFDSRQLRIFLSVVREKSFTIAARKLNMTQPALTRSVQLLEERIGVRLIERTSKSFALTKFGRVVVDRALLIEREFDLLLREVRSVQDGTTGVMNIGVGRSAIGYVSQTIMQFQKERPGTSVNITVDTAEANYQALLNGELDIMCTALNFPKQARLVTEKIAEIQNIVLADRAHPLCGQRNVPASELVKFPWILFSSDQLGYERICSYFAAKNVDPPEPAIETNALEVLLGLLQGGSYLASVPSLVLPAASALGLGEIDVHGAFWSVPIGTTYMRSNNPPPAVTSLALILRQHFEKQRSENSAG